MNARQAVLMLEVNPELFQLPDRNSFGPLSVVAVIPGRHEVLAPKHAGFLSDCQTPEWLANRSTTEK